MMARCPSAKNLDAGGTNQILLKDLINCTCINLIPLVIQVLCSGAKCHHDWTLYFPMFKVLIRGAKCHHDWSLYMIPPLECGVVGGKFVEPRITKKFTIGGGKNLRIKKM